MKQNIIGLVALLISGALFSQVGVNTPNPQGVFNIDGAKDNPKTGSAHTAAQQMNDITVLANGNVGVGTIAPTQKVHIVAPAASSTVAPSGFKLVDGNQKQNRVLQSDAQGVGSWYALNAAKGLATGVFGPAGSVISSNTDRKYTKVKVNVTKGQWLISIGLVVQYNTDSSSDSRPYWLHGYISSNETSYSTAGITLNGPAGSGTCYAGAILKDPNSANRNFFTGTILATFNQDMTVYIFLENYNLTNGTDGTVLPQTDTNSMWKVDPLDPANFCYAIPVNS